MKKNLFENLVRPGAIRTLLLAAVAVGFSSALSASVWDDAQSSLLDFDFGGGVTNWIDGDLVITYTNATDVLFVPGSATVRVLAVGGGGGGGRVRDNTADHGGGGGGGGGGGVVAEGIALKGRYVIAVGRGGAAGSCADGEAAEGGDGGDTSFASATGAAVLAAAKGGGGGGALGAGRNGGCGGGGSKSPSGSGAGGAGVSGQGYAGGTGAANYQGGGGGGAGEQGQKASIPAFPRRGGNGLESDIAGTAAYYGGGGAGGNTMADFSSRTDNYGGSGGGGRGGSGSSAVNASPAGDGKDGFGGGGGGGGMFDAATAGAGGCGVLIVRLTAYVAGGIPFPKPVTVTYDGTEHLACRERSEYRLSGDYRATNVGTYTYTVELADTNLYEWEDGSKGPTNITWTIERRQVAIPQAESGLVYNSSRQRVSVADSESEAYYTLSGDYQVNAGSGFFSAQLNDATNTGWTDGTTQNKSIPWTIAKATNEIVRFQMADWQVGATAPTPELVVKSGSEVAPEYRYGFSADGPFDISEISATPGYQWVRGAAEGSGNWTGVAATNRFNVWVHPKEVFTDFVDITISGVAFDGRPLVLSFSERDLPGFSYVRAGGAAYVRFVARNPDGDSTKDELLHYAVKAWNAQDGSSTVRVKSPSRTGSELTVRMYWHLKEGDDPRSVNDEDAVTGAESTPTVAFGLVNRAGTWVNYWTTKPAWTADASSAVRQWDEDSAPADVRTELNDYALKVGTASLSCYIQPIGPVVSDLPRTNGFYEISFVMDDLGDGEDYVIDGSPVVLEYEIVGHTRLPAVDTGSGRILLANNDTNATLGAITGQAYWQTSATAADTYWNHTGTASPSRINYPNLNRTSHHELCHKSGVVLWRLENVLIGNLFQGTQEFSDQRVYLPWSETSEANSSQAAAFARKEIGHLAMRNTTGAVIYSPCYTNGIGTIYFDAVNGLVDGAAGGAYGLVVEVAKSTLGNTDPTDANMGSEWDPSAFAWEAVGVIPLKTEGGASFQAQPATEEVELNETTGGGNQNFYRIYAQLNYAGPIRFRIRRSAINEAVSALDGSFLLIDNIVVSEPATKLNLAAPSDGVLSIPYPSVADTNVMGRAQLVETNAPHEWISAARLYYRWRYLNQRVDEWKSCFLDTSDSAGLFTTVRPLEFEGLLGDVEYYYELTLNAPYYEYQDYSGAGIVPATGNYTEEFKKVVNGRTESTVLPSLGTNWYVRLREGRSDYERLQVKVKIGDEEFVPRDGEMTLRENHTWRGYLQTTNGMPDTIRFRIEAFRPGVTNILYSSVESTEFPIAGKFVSNGTTNDWTTIPCDSLTGYLMFQVDDEDLNYSIVHANYQNFNMWHDAHHTYFSGASTEESEPTSGVSPSVREYKVDYSTRADTTATDSGWQVHFTDTIGERGYEGYEPFLAEDDVTYNGWKLGAGMYVYGNYRDPGSKMAYQMAGRGMGYIQMTDPIVTPRGFGSISFEARLAQEIDPEKFSRFEGGWVEVGVGAHWAPTLKDYSFFSRVAFDQNGNTNFAGNASLSLMAYYRAGAGGGCYEARWEQIGADTNQYGVVKGPRRRGQRLTLYRWNTEASGLYVATELFSVTNGVSKSSAGQDWAFDPPLLGAAALTNSSTRALTPFFISAYGEGESTIVVAGVRASGVSYAGGDTASTLGGSDWMCISYRDGTEKRLTRGSFGLLSANCEGIFVRPAYYSQAVGPLVDESQVAAAYTGESLDLTGGSFREYSDDKEMWVVSAGRQMVTNWLPAVATFCGFEAAPVSQTIDLYVAPLGSVNPKWEKIDSFELNGFGRPGNTERFSASYYRTDDCAVRLRTGGTLSDVRTDVTINNIVLNQWRGEDEDISSYADSRLGAPTNFVYTSGWVTNGLLRLAAKQTSPDVGKSPAAIRSPLLDGYDGHGRGLGMIGFSYENMQTNTVLLVQVVTNYVSGDLASLTSADSADARWLTVTNLTYGQLGPSGKFRRDFGLHGVRGVMRIVLDKATVAAVSNTTDVTAFGGIDIREISCQDEPPLDAGCWWGWNLRTVGDADDSEMRMFLPDCTQNSSFGRSFALNNSVVNDIDGSIQDPTVYKRHSPFLQSPTFTNNVVGEVSFRARVYETNETAYVTLYGALQNRFDDGDWTKLRVYQVTNTTYQTFGYKVDSSQSAFRAFRFVVTGVDGTPEAADKPLGNEPTRILLDEVTISEALRARLAFRNVGVFRSHMSDNSYIPNLPTSSEQPLAGEGWGVQAEVYTAMLEAEVDKDAEPQVFLHWFSGTEPWGYENWKDDGSAGFAELSKAEGTNDVYRSSYMGSPAAVVFSSNAPGEVVQYMLEVRYQTINSQSGTRSEATNWLEQADWQVPAWYAPVNYNTDRAYGGASGAFAAFNILDSVAPGWAWINEVNVLGMYDENYNNTDLNAQYVEIAAPVDADLTGWEVRFLDLSTADSRITTNVVAQFGTSDLPGLKRNNMNESSNMVFRTLASSGLNSNLKVADGSLDAVWQFSELSDLFRRTPTGIYCINDAEIPFGIQLVRPSGVVEHSVGVVGTNRWATSRFQELSLTNVVAELSRLTGCAFTTAGEDHLGAERSLSVTQGRGESAAAWTNAWVWTPGRINSDGRGNYQQLDPDHPTPQGESIILYAKVDTAFGHILQTVGSGVETDILQTLVLKRGNEGGTNIVYTIDPWYELGTVSETESGVGPRIPTVTKLAAPRTWVVNVGKGASNNVTVVASAAVESKLREDYGLDADNAYTPAVIDWLTNGQTLRGAFKNAAEGEIHLADYVALNNSIVTNLTLTQMYWLDIDPTVSNQMFKAGICKPSVPDLPKPVPGYEGDVSLTNVKMSVFMMISNRTDGTAWSPYALRGLQPGSSSWDYTGNWTSVTFKVTGILANGLTSEGNPKAWIPLRWFVFRGKPNYEESFWQPEDEAADSAHAAFTADIEITDPHSTASPGYSAGWYDWEKEHGYTPIFHSWNIDTRLVPVGVEVLEKQNYLIKP